ncbi:MULTISPECIES: ferritin-like domain-containing protein [Bacillus]|uniref:ferritin-like domain-containing protein n=1 Tax=Bacillus TaxID=1386 RepID=UPI001142D0B3|nr:MULTISPECIES: ferritin-like domain-containing protein [Bacillus]
MYTNPYYQYAQQYWRTTNDSILVSDIQKAINGEYSAVQCYEKLAEMAPTEKERDRILEIRKDEIRHLEEFSRLYLNLTGRQPQPEIGEECAETYTEALEASFIDEQETVDFYLDIADKAKDILIKKAFRRAAADEQNHAVWFLFFFQKI